MSECIRRIQLEGSGNFRDLGGYCTVDGHTTTWGKLFRSGSLADLTENDIMTLERLNIKTVVDLRCKTEADSRKDIIPSISNYFHCPVQDFEVNPDGSPITTFDNTLSESYERMLSKTGHLFCEALNTVIEGLKIGSVVFHCSAGKDRTGTLAATVLKLLNVCDEDICADYQVTSTYNRLLFKALNKEKADNYSYMYDSNPDNLNELFNFFSRENLEQHLLNSGLKAENLIFLKQIMIV